MDEWMNFAFHRNFSIIYEAVMSFWLVDLRKGNTINKK